MIFFSTNQNRNCLSANNTKRKYRLKRQTTEPHDTKNNSLKLSQSDKQNLPHPPKSLQTTHSCVDPFKEQMKYLIEQNSQYFQNKVKVTDKVRPNQYRFKIPTKTPVTIYKKSFQSKQKDLSVDDVKLNRNNLSQVIKIKEPVQNLIFKSTYQNQFILKKQSIKNRRNSFSRSKLKKWQEKEEDEVPRFLQTQNKCFYLNWGGRNSTTSLKPSYQTIATNSPFDGRTIYKNDFQGKSVAPSQIIIPQGSISKLSNTFMINSSCYSRQFSQKQKKPEVEKSYKPKHIPVKMTQSFQGSTEYRSQFIRNKGLSGCFSHQIKKQDLHELILDL